MAKEKKEDQIDKIREHFDYMRDFFAEYSNEQLGEDPEKKLPEFTDEEMMIYSGHKEHTPQPPANPPVNE